MVNKYGIIIHKIKYKKGRMYDHDIYRKNNPLASKQVVNYIFDLGYLDVVKDFPEQLSSIPNRKET